MERRAFLAGRGECALARDSAHLVERRSLSKFGFWSAPTVLRDSNSNRKDNIPWRV